MSGPLLATRASVTAQRIIVAGATTSVTRRCNLRKAFLAPWDRRVTQVRLYSIADAQRNTGVEVHHSVEVVTHSHTNVTPSIEQFATGRGLVLITFSHGGRSGSKSSVQRYL